MKKEDMYEAVSNINPDILDDVDSYTKSKIKRKRYGWKIGTLVAACAIFVLCLLYFPFSAKESDSQFTITAYALDAKGELVGVPFAVGQIIPMTQIELSSGIDCFLFSVDLNDSNLKSKIHAYATTGIGISEQEEILSRNIEKTGKAYFYFVPDERMKTGECLGMDIPCNETSITEEEYILRIRRNEGGFTAQLMDAEMYQKERDHFFEPKESDIIP